MIEAANLGKRFGRTVALRDVSFRIERGAKVALLGPNGAGKTTLMRLLAGYLAPTQGRVTIAGFPADRDSMAIRERIGYLPENNALYPEMRVSEYLRFRSSLKGLGGRDRPQRIRELIGQCGLKGLEGALLSRLSKGEARRVLLADCLVAAPELLLLDEPTLGVDALRGAEIRELLRGLAPEQTVLLATHSLEEAQALCNRAMVLIKGRLALADTAANVWGGKASLAEVFRSVKPEEHAS
jgi:ABC-2 type transport system ATP-binding protein